MSNLTLACRRTSLALCLAGGLPGLRRAGRRKSRRSSFCARCKTRATARWPIDVSRSAADRSDGCRRNWPRRIDLELSRSYRISLGEAFNAAEAERAAGQGPIAPRQVPQGARRPSRSRPGHGVVGRHRARSGADANPTGSDRRATRRKRKSCWPPARADLEEARPRFADATSPLPEHGFHEAQGGRRRQRQRTAERPRRRSPRNSARPTPRWPDAEIAWLECRFKLAKVDFLRGRDLSRREIARAQGGASPPPPRVRRHLSILSREPGRPARPHVARPSGRRNGRRSAGAGHLRRSAGHGARGTRSRRRRSTRCSRKCNTIASWCRCGRMGSTSFCRKPAGLARRRTKAGPSSTATRGSRWRWPRPSCERRPSSPAKRSAT